MVGWGEKENSSLGGGFFSVVCAIINILYIQSTPLPDSSQIGRNRSRSNDVEKEVGTRH